MTKSKAVIFGTVIIIVLAVGIYGIYQTLVRRDFDTICLTYTEALARRNSTDPAILYYEIGKKHEQLLTSPGKDIVFAASVIDHKQADELFLEAAAHNGYSEWNCPAIKTFFQ